MSRIIAGRLDDLPSTLRHRLGSFRHRIFVQRLHWDIPGVSPAATVEWDEFDGGNTVHLVALSTDETVCGCARLMPTTGPYLLRDVFPHLACPDSVPSSPTIWEMSRFAGTGVPSQLVGTTSGMALFPYSMALAASFGATRLVGVVSRSIARLYRRYGLNLVDIGGDASGGSSGIVACAIDLTPMNFTCIHCDAGALLNAISRVGELELAASPPVHHPAVIGEHTDWRHARSNVSLTRPADGLARTQAVL